MRIVTILTPFVFAQQLVGIVFLTPAHWTWEGQTAAFISAACGCVIFSAFAAGAEKLLSLMHESLALWTQVFIAVSLWFAAGGHVMIAACPIQAVHG